MRGEILCPLKTKEFEFFLSKFETPYRRWGDKTSYLKNVKCSGEPKNMAALTL